jgi:S-adenosylmethionine hydrolase
VTRPFVTFLSDFGLQDDFVGTCHGVIKRIAPDAEILDITHGVPPAHVLQGALVLRNTLPFMPGGVHLAVVDPEVGGARRPLALRDAGGRLYVGPDNGLLVPAAESFGGILAAHEVANREYALEPVSATFHGRDLFAPAAAHLALGLDVSALGPAIDPDTLVRPELPEPVFDADRIEATVLYVDRYGNMQLNLRVRDLDEFGIDPGMHVELILHGERYYGVAARTFTDVQAGDIVLYEDSYLNVAVAINRGNAAELMSARAGQAITVRRRG